METKKKTETENLFIQTCPAPARTINKDVQFQSLWQDTGHLYLSDNVTIVFFILLYQSSQWETIIMANLI